MATSETTNLQLVKYGAGTDNFIRTDYNGNLDKIDNFAGNTNQAIANCIGKSFSANSMDDIPMNAFGVGTFQPGTGLAATNVTCPYFSSGDSSTKTVLAYRGNQRIYINNYTSNAWVGWKQLYNVAYEDMTGTTDSSGNITKSNYCGKVLSILPIRNDSNYYTSFYMCIEASNTSNNQTIIHCMKADGTALASTAVKFRLYYLDL